MLSQFAGLSELDVLSELEQKSIFEKKISEKPKEGPLDFQKIFFLKFKNNNLKHSKNYQKHFIFTYI